LMGLVKDSGWPSGEAGGGQLPGRRLTHCSPRSLRSAVTRVRSYTWAVATRKRSAGSGCGSSTCLLRMATSCVRGASRSGASRSARRIQTMGSGSSRTRPFSARTRTSQTLMGDSHTSVRASVRAATTAGPSRSGASSAHKKIWVSRRSLSGRGPPVGPRPGRGSPRLPRCGRCHGGSPASRGWGQEVAARPAPGAGPCGSPGSACLCA
jgi:hypothetical protein